MWVPPEDIDPVVLHAPTRKSVGLYGAVHPDSGKLVVRRETKFKAETFLPFLSQLLRHRRRGRRMIVIVDNAKWHHARLLGPWLWDHRRELVLDFLPPYSPELNAIERVWKLTRRLCTHNRYFPALEDLVTIVFDQFALWCKPNHTLHKLCAVI
jgi:transposase